ncbi:MFS transporter [Phototrophicus methaneseepsis]|uniref:MFS transporter n=1 Tax=Phototrophicus methaneseepsis TaxID=2710758 RepID=A0A7S8EBT1_9CHLR|nr:MFS transporter [Phototrophicus methaneseepsis]QPC84026.1 MFS transporter [Phototrophicus methaneseepsis]
MAASPTTTEKIRALPWSLAGGAANSVFAQLTFFGSTFILFLSELNISTAQIGFLLSLLPFMGLVALFIAPTVARFGFKRTFLTFYVLRKVITAFLMALPLVMVQFGPEATLIAAALIVFGFGLCRAIAETGYYPWVQEFIPGSMRGKFSATSNVFGNLAAIAAVALASYVLALPGGLERFQFLFVVAVGFGFLAIWFYMRVPGGAPADPDGAPPATYGDMLRTLRDNNLLLYLAGFALITFATGPLHSFLPLFMEEHVGLTTSQIVLLSTASMVGALILSNLLGWSADRYGSKPVMLVGVVFFALLPIGWMLMPRNSPLSLLFALGIAFFQGIAGTAWMVGSGRLLFVSVVPDAEKSQYMAVYYAAIGIIGGVSQLIGGSLLDAFSSISGQFLFLSLDAFTPLMIAGIVLPLLSLLVFQRVRSDSEVTVGEYAGMFVQGNPIYALENLVRFYRARDERSVVVMTEKLGKANSPLTVDELLEALADPRFNVRFEAIISIARMPSHPRLTKALTEILLGTELSLSNVSAWALGRIGDPDAVAALRAGLNSEYRSIRAHCARALGTLKDMEVKPLLLERLLVEEDKGLQMAYAVALGNLHSVEAMAKLHSQLIQTENEGARMELALSLARIAGRESEFISLLRQMRSDPGTGAAQAMIKIRQRVNKIASPETRKLLIAASDAFAVDDLDGGAAYLVELVRALPSPTDADEGTYRLLHYCADDLVAHKASRIELLVLMLHVLQTDFSDSPHHTIQPDA